MKTKDRVVIGWCDPGQVEGDFALSLALISCERSSRLGPFVRVEGSALVSRQRNEIVATFLDQTKADWLLMLDADESISIAAFDKLLSAAHDTERPVVAGLYFGAFDQGALIPTPIPLLYRANNHGYQPLHDYPTDTVIEVDSAGTGCLLIHRKVLEHLRTLASEDEGPNWCWFNDGPIGGRWYGEDVIFCRRIKNAGFPIHAHTGAQLGHRKRFWLTAKHHEALRSAPMPDTTEVPKPEPKKERAVRKAATEKAVKE